MTATQATLAWVNALGGLAGFTALGIALVQSRRRRSVPDPQLRHLLEGLMDDFNSIHAQAGQPTSWFNEPERRRRELALASLNGAVVDDALNLKIASARAEYLNCFTFASPSRPPDHIARQISAAATGSSAAGAAIDRINVLTRKYAHL